MNTANNNCDPCKGAGVDLVMYSSLVSIVLSRGLTIVQLALLSSFIQSIGQNLSLIAAAKARCDEVITNNTTNNTTDNTSDNTVNNTTHNTSNTST